MTTRNQKKGFAYQVCKFDERGNRLMSFAFCTTHTLLLSTRSHPRQIIGNKDGKEISDYSWMAPTNDSMSCWEKAHSFYIPRGLFLAGASIKDRNQEKLKFGNAAVSSEHCLAKSRAFGLAPTWRGDRRSRGKTPAAQVGQLG